MNKHTQTRRGGLPSFDALDRFLLALFLLLAGIAAPVVIGARNTPWLGGRPALLNPQIRSEQAFVATARKALTAIDETHRAVSAITPVAGSTESYSGSQRMQTRVEVIESMVAEWRRITPPGRFAGMHRRLGDALAAAQRIATEAWAYYGDLNIAHLDVIKQALPAGETEQTQLVALLDAMDFASAPPSVTPAPLPQNKGVPTPGAWFQK